MAEIHFRPFALDDLAEIAPHLPPAFAAAIARLLRPEIALHLEGPFSWTACVDGTALGCGGIKAEWPGRGIAWVLTAPGMDRRAWPAVTRKTLAVLALAHDAGMRRIDATVPADFAAGHRWIQRLGFVRYGLLWHYAPDGADHFGYARVAA